MFYKDYWAFFEYPSSTTAEVVYKLTKIELNFNMAFLVMTAEQTLICSLTAMM